MRKMTYTQAATCGENLKVRVTPEQSEKMQKAWFAAGKTWADGITEICETTECFLYLHDDDDLTAGSSISEFENHVNTEIKLIDDLPQYDFASQQEVWQWAVQGNKVVGISDGKVYGFKDGEMFLYSNNMPVMSCDFSKYWNWKKHTPPRLIRVNGVEVPAPLESLDGLKWVYSVQLDSENGFSIVPTIPKTSTIEKLLKLGLLYENEQDAIKRAEAMVKYEVVE